MGIGGVWVGRAVGDAVGRGNGRLLGPGVATPEAMDIWIGVDVRGCGVGVASSGARVQPAAMQEAMAMYAMDVRTFTSTPPCRTLRSFDDELHPNRRAFRLTAVSYRTTLKLNIGVPIVPISRSHSGSTISVPRALVMSPTSMTSRQPKPCSSSVTVVFASASLPQTKTL